MLFSKPEEEAIQVKAKNNPIEEHLLETKAELAKSLAKLIPEEVEIKQQPCSEPEIVNNKPRRGRGIRKS